LGVLGGTLDGHELKFAPIFFAKTASQQGKPVSITPLKSSFSRKESLQCYKGQLFVPNSALLPLPINSHAGPPFIHLSGKLHRTFPHSHKEGTECSMKI
jgi:hypothetical protein